MEELFDIGGLGQVGLRGPGETQLAEDRRLVDQRIRDLNSRLAEVQARIRYLLETRGTPIGPYDLQIASIALHHGLTVVTHNVAEFSRVPGLTVEDWEVP